MGESDNERERGREMAEGGGEGAVGSGRCGVGMIG